MKNSIRNKVDYDILICGGGPAGMTAAIYAKRAESNVAMVEKGAPGGKVVKTSEVENYPGFNSILGPDLAFKMFEQTQTLGVPYLGKEILEITKENDVFIVHCNDNQKLTARAIIVATGTVERKLGVPNEDTFYGKGVSYCAVCDGAFYKNQRVVVVGGGYAALEESMYLTKFASEIIIIHRRQGFRADDKVVARAHANQKIKFILDSVVTKIIGDKTVTAVEYKNVLTNEVKTIETSGIFPYIGADPITNFVSKLGICDDKGYIVVNNRCETTIPGLFAAGDVTNTSLRQIATAVSDGAKAGQFAIEYLDH